MAPRGRRGATTPPEGLLARPVVSRVQVGSSPSPPTLQSVARSLPSKPPSRYTLLVSPSSSPAIMERTWRKWDEMRHDTVSGGSSHVFRWPALRSRSSKAALSYVSSWRAWTSRVPRPRVRGSLVFKDLGGFEAGRSKEHRELTASCMSPGLRTARRLAVCWVREVSPAR